METRTKKHRSIIITEVRAASADSRTIEGYALLFDVESTSLPTAACAW